MSAAPSPKAQSWLWPDHQISKRESRRLREEHNALVNINAELLNHEKQTHEELGAILGTDDNLRECAMRMRDALAQLLKWIDCGCDPSTKSLDAARAVLGKAKAEPKVINGPGDLRCTTVERRHYDEALANATRLHDILQSIRVILWPAGNQFHVWSPDTVESIASVILANEADHDADFGMKGGVS